MTNSQRPARGRGYLSSTPWKKRCHVTNKVRYRDPREARTGLWSAQEANRRGYSRRHESRFYKCPFCKGWHLTSKERRSTKAED